MVTPAAVADMRYQLFATGQSEMIAIFGLVQFCIKSNTGW